MIAQEVEFIESLFETLKADVTGHVREEVRKLHERLDVAHHKLNVALSALSHAIPRITAMSAIHDEIAAALAETDTLIAGVQSSAEALEALKDDGDSKSADLLSKVQAQNSTLQSIKSALDAAVAADTPAASPAQTSGSTDASAPVTSVGAASTTATTQDGSTTTVDHSTGLASTVSSDGTPVPTDDTAAQAAKAAAVQAGVVVPNA